MPRIIVKFMYYNSGKVKTNLGGMLTYIATRENVEKFNDSWKSSNATAKQIEFINTIKGQYKSVVNTNLFKMFEKSKTRGNASELISSFIEMHPDILESKTYLDYIGTRPRVEKAEGTHGLFSSENKIINLKDASKEVAEYEGNVFTIIASLKREDAERLGYNNAKTWMDFVRANISEIAKEYSIPLKDIEWYGAFHNEGNHPHIHLMLYSKNESYKGFINKQGIAKLKNLFGTEIFKDEIINIYEEQTKHRNTLQQETIDEFNLICQMVEKGLCNNKNIVDKISELSEKIKTVKGKKQYGYLPANVKRLVDDIVDELEKDENIKRLYDLWYECKCKIYQTYTDNLPPKLPLSQEKVFKPIRNAVVKRASEMALDFDEREIVFDNQEDEESDSDDEKTHEETSGETESKTEYHKVQININTNGGTRIITQVTRLGKDISNTFQDNYQKLIDNPKIQVDSRLRREIEAKKKGISIRM